MAGVGRLNDAVALVAPLVEGVLRFEEGHPRQARDKLEAGLAGLDRFRAASHFVAMMQDGFRAYLALSLAVVGDRAEAERQLRLAEPRLRALQRTELLDRCQRAVVTFADHK